MYYVLDAGALRPLRRHEQLVSSTKIYALYCNANRSFALRACTLLRDADRISQLSWLGRWLYVAERTPRGTGMGCNDLTSPVLQLRKYQTHELQIRGVHVSRPQSDVLPLRDRALPLATSLVWGLAFNNVSLSSSNTVLRARTVISRRVARARTGSRSSSSR